MKKIAVIAANFQHVFPAYILRVIERKVGGAVELIKCSTSALPDYETGRLKKILENQKPDGLIAVSLNPSKSALDEYSAQGVPTVIIDEFVEGHTVIATDNYQGGYIAGTCLGVSGKKKPAIITGKTQVSGGLNARLRKEGFEAALKERSVLLDKKAVVEIVSYSYKEGDESLRAIIDSGFMPDSLFCAAGDMCAMGVMKAAREKSIKIPEELSVIGYDDIEKAAATKPPLTTIRQPVKQMAETAVDLILNKKEKLLKYPEKILFNPELIMRETVK